MQRFPHQFGPPALHSARLQHHILWPHIQQAAARQIQQGKADAKQHDSFVGACGKAVSLGQRPVVVEEIAIQGMATGLHESVHHAHQARIAAFEVGGEQGEEYPAATIAVNMFEYNPVQAVKPLYRWHKMSARHPCGRSAAAPDGLAPKIPAFQPVGAKQRNGKAGNFVYLPNVPRVSPQGVQVGGVHAVVARLVPKQPKHFPVAGLPVACYQVLQYARPVQLAGGCRWWG